MTKYDIVTVYNMNLIVLDTGMYKISQVNHQNSKFMNNLVEKIGTIYCTRSFYDIELDDDENTY